MLRNNTILTMKIVGVLFAGIMLTVLALGWRLTTGPVSLDFAREFLAKSLTPNDAGMTVEIGEPVLSWGGWDRVFDVTVNDVVLRSKDDAFVVSAPSIHVRLSATTLADGLVAPVRITLEHPDVQLGPRFAAMESFDTFSKALSDYLAPPTHSSRIKHLDLVEIIDGTLTFTKPLPLGVMGLQKLDATLTRDSGNLRVDGTAQAVISGHPTQLTTNLFYDDKDQRITGTASVAGLPGSTLNGVLTKAHANTALTGVIDAGAKIDFSIQHPARLLLTSMSISVTKGTLQAPGLITSAIVFDTLSARALYDADQEKLDITPIQIVKDKVVATGSVAMRGIFDEPEVTISARTQNVPVDHLHTYWPAGVGDLARNWILKNLEHGIAESAHMEATGSISGKKSWSGFSLSSLSGEIDFSGVTTHFLRPLRPATGTSGRAKFTDDQFDIIINSSKVDDLVFHDTKVRFFDLDTNVEKAEIDLIARGPLKTALRLLNHESLSLVSRIDLDPTAIDGSSESRIRLTFPMTRSLKLDDIEIDVSANLDNVSLANLVFKQSLSGGRLTLDLNRKAMRVSGTGLLGGTSATLDLEEIFDSASQIRSRKKIQGQIKLTAIKALKVPKSIGAEGNVEIEADIVKYADGVSKVSAVIDLANAAISIPAMRWLKPIGAAGLIRLDLGLKHERVTAPPSASIVAAGLGADLRAEFDPSTGNLSRIILDRLRLKESEMKGVIVLKGDNSFHAELEGPRLDLTRFMLKNYGTPPQPGPVFTVTGRFDEILIGILPPIRQGEMTIKHNGSLLAYIQLDEGKIGEESIKADLTTMFDPLTGYLSRIHLRQLKLGDSKIDGVIVPKSENSYQMELDGPRLNVVCLLDKDNEGTVPPGTDFTFEGSANCDEFKFGILPPIRKAKMTFSHNGSHLDVKLEEGKIGEEPIKADLTAEFDQSTGNLSQIKLRRLNLVDSEISGVIDRKGDNSYSAKLEGPRLDVRRLLDRDHDGLSEPGPDFEFQGTAQFEELQLDVLPPIRKAKITFSHNGSHFDVKLDEGKIGEEPIWGQYEAQDGTSRFEIGTDDAEQVLGGFGMLGTINGGRLNATAVTTGAGLTKKTKIELTVDEFGLSNAPVLAQLLNAAFLPGLVDLVQGKGIRFKTLNAEINLSEGKAEIVDALAFGNSLGISIQGEIDLPIKPAVADSLSNSKQGEIDATKQLVNVGGMIVPAYRLNQLVNQISDKLQIPFLGKFITGGKNEGLLATEYLITGQRDKPNVMVNPLTALTPGFLRFLLKATGNIPPVEQDQQQTETFGQ